MHSVAQLYLDILQMTSFKEFVLVTDPFMLDINTMSFVYLEKFRNYNCKKLTSFVKDSKRLCMRFN